MSVHPYYDGDAYRRVQVEAEAAAEATGKVQISGYDSWAGWIFRDYGHGDQSDYELTETSIYYPPRERNP